MPGRATIWPYERLLTRDGQPLPIGGRSFDLLVALIEKPGAVLSKRDLLKRVWSDVVVEDGSLRFHMAGLRKMLGDGEDGARYIATQVAVGYAFVAPVERRTGAGGASGSVEPMADPVTSGDGRVPNLPPQPHLVGRERDVEMLGERIAGTPLFTIVGPAGVGKTSLAVEIAHRKTLDFDGQEDSRNQLRMLARLHIFNKRLGDYAAARSHAERAIEAAAQIGDDEAFGIAYFLSGISHYLAGDLAHARDELKQAMAESGPTLRSRTIRYGFDNRSRTGIALAFTLWLAGETEQANLLARQTVRETAQLDHGITQCIALVWAAIIHLWSGDIETTEEAVDALSARAEASALAPYSAAAEGFRGALDFERSLDANALAVLEKSIAGLRAARYELLVTPFTLMLLWGLLRSERLQEAQDLVEATISRCEELGELFSMPELLRIKADLVQRRDGDHVMSEMLMRDAVSLARWQGAHAWQGRIEKILPT